MVPCVLRKKDRIIAGVKARVLKKRFKYGFEVPETVAQEIELDEINGNTLWQDGIDLIDLDRSGNSFWHFKAVFEALFQDSSFYNHDDLGPFS